MAALIGKITAGDSRRTKSIHRLASQSVVAEANSWVTFARVEMLRNGSGKCTIKRGGITVHSFEWEPEQGGK